MLKPSHSHRNNVENALIVLPYLRGVSQLVLGTGAGQLALLAAAPFLARLYSPTDFGILAVFVSILALLLPLATLRYEFAIPVPRSDVVARHLAELAFIGLTGFAVLCLFGAWILNGPFLGTGERIIADPRVLWMVSPALLLIGAFQILRMSAVRARQFNVVARVKLIQGLAGAVSQIGMGLLYASAYSLIAGHIIANAAGARALLGRRSSMFPALNKRVLAKLRITANRYRRFPQWLVPAHWANAASIEALPLLLTALFSPAMAGHFFLAHRIVGAPVGILSRSIADAFLGEAGNTARTRDGNLSQLFWRVVLWIGAGSLGPCILLFVYGQELVTIAFGQGWATAGMFVEWFSVLFFLRLALEAPTQFSIIERTDLALIWSITRITLVAFAVLWSYLVEANGVQLVFWYTVAMSGAYALKLLLWVWAMHSRLIESN